ncbi:MAG TPA: cysteine desulfurase family protein [Candidatus Lumbricidophila sp.]|nr:cysteine desulfurase family protein [Candidatus Lumbricidophila sp.]
MIYLDHAATNRVRRQALEAMWPYLTDEFGNPSSTHELGERAARALADARAHVASVIGCRSGDVVFTSGGTEADNLAVLGLSLANPRGRHVVVSPIEHEAVLESAGALARLHGFTVDQVAVDGFGTVHPDALDAVLRDDTTLVSVQLANNEIGTIEPIAALAERAHARSALLHSDAVQAAGWLPLNLDDLGVDALSLSGHKFGAPKGTGALIVRGRLPLEPLIHGGGQERGRRSGTENVAGAVAFATALRLAEAERVDAAARLSALSERFITRVLGEVPTARLTGHPTDRLPGTLSFVFPGLNGESLLLELERVSVYASSGSACAAGSTEASHVLTAIGLEAEVAHTAVRLTAGAETSADELDAAAAALIDAVATIGGYAPGSPQR